jgi:drug/metabolite transporter (DMT)-like permease
MPMMAAASASVFFGASVTATRFVVADIDPLLLAWLRYLIGALCLLPFVLAGPRPTLSPRDILSVGFLGIVFFGLFPWFFSAGLQFIPASRAAVWLSAMPFLTFALATVLRYESFTATKGWGVVLATAGAVLALGRRDAVHLAELAWLGDLLLFGTACCGAVYFVMSRGLLKRHPALVVTWLSMVAGVLFLGLIAATMSRLRVPHLTHSGWASVLFLGTFGAALGFYLWLWALQRLTPTKTAVFLTLNPIAATLLSVGLLGERVGLGFMLGLVLVLAGIVVANLQAGAATTHRVRP